MSVSYKAFQRSEYSRFIKIIYHIAYLTSQLAYPVDSATETAFQQVYSAFQKKMMQPCIAQEQMGSRIHKTKHELN